MPTDKRFEDVVEVLRLLKKPFLLLEGELGELELRLECHMQLPDGVTIRVCGNNRSCAFLGEQGQRSDGPGTTTEKGYRKTNRRPHELIHHEANDAPAGQ